MDRRFTLPPDYKKKLYSGRIVLPSENLLREPKPSGAIETQLLFGQGFDVYGELKTALYGRVKPLVRGSRRKGYLGYIRKESLSAGLSAPTHMVTALATPVFKQADIKSGIKTRGRAEYVLPMNAHVKPIAQSGDLFELAGLGFIHDKHIRKIEKDIPADFVSVAEKFLGQPYIWGGTGRAGVDCSGLVQMALAACEIDASRDADQQEKHLGMPVDLSEAQRGDLIFWSGHVGIMVGKTRLLHANAHHMETATEPLKKAIQRIGPPRSVKRL